jgi:hypothetical protein
VLEERPCRLVARPARRVQHGAGSGKVGGPLRAVLQEHRREAAAPMLRVDPDVADDLCVRMLGPHLGKGGDVSVAGFDEPGVAFRIGSGPCETLPHLVGRGMPDALVHQCAAAHERREALDTLERRSSNLYATFSQKRVYGLRTPARNRTISDPPSVIPPNAATRTPSPTEAGALASDDMAASATDALELVRAELGDARDWEGDARVVWSELEYADGEPVCVDIRKRRHRYDVHDGGGAVARARYLGVESWEDVASEIVDAHDLNLNRRGVIFVPAVEGGIDVAWLAFRVARCSYAVHSELLDTLE